MFSLCIYRGQRGLWMNADGNMKPGVCELRKAEILRRKELADKKEKAKLNRENKVKVKNAEDKANESDIEYIINPSKFCICSNECSHTRRDCLVAHDDGWRGCPVCLKMYCNKVNCQKKLAMHAAFCLVERDLKLNINCCLLLACCLAVLLICSICIAHCLAKQYINA